MGDLLLVLLEPEDIRKAGIDERIVMADLASIIRAAVKQSNYSARRASATMLPLSRPVRSPDQPV